MALLKQPKQPLSQQPQAGLGPRFSTTELTPCNLPEMGVCPRLFDET